MVMAAFPPGRGGATPHGSASGRATIAGASRIVVGPAAPGPGVLDLAASDVSQAPLEP